MLTSSRRSGATQLLSIPTDSVSPMGARPTTPGAAGAIARRGGRSDAARARRPERAGDRDHARVVTHLDGEGERGLDRLETSAQKVHRRGEGGEAERAVAGEREPERAQV